MPILSRVLSGQLTETNPTETAGNTSWETVSTVSRALNFVLTVRDRSEANGTGQFPQSDFDFMAVTVDGSSGPFGVTSQTTNETWTVGTTETVTWDVAGTNAGAVNTPTVNIRLSTDGGQTFPHVLATNVTNDGSHSFSVPATGGDSTQLRVMVEGNNNIFFAVSSIDFTLQESEFAMAVATPSVQVCSPNDVTYDFTYNTFLGFTGTTTFSAVGLPAGANATFSPTSATADGTSVTLTVNGIGSVAQGSYNFQITGTSGSIVKSADVDFTIFSNSIDAPTLTSPSDALTGVGLTPTIEWTADGNALSYDYEVATDNGFTTIVQSGNTSATSIVLSSLNQTTTYYWRVRSKNTCGDGPFATAFSFTTINCTACASVANTTFDTSTTRVIFNTIDNPSGKPSGYSDYTGMSTDVNRDESYDLTVQANTDGNYTTHTVVWIDWNQNCDFDDAGEMYDLGEADNVADGVTSLSPLSITVPTDAVFGTTIMRVSTRYNSDPTSCQNGVDAEVEDYSIVVVDNTASIEDFAFDGFNLYPNPSNGDFNLRFNVESNDEVSIRVFDVRGRTVYRKQYTNVPNLFAENIVINNMAKGVYLLKISNGNKQTTRKLVIR